jgi:hypothetical protein
MLAEVEWFGGLFSDLHRAALGEFGAKVEQFRARHANDCPDVEEILASPEWQALTMAAGILLEFLQIPPDI